MLGTRGKDVGTGHEELPGERNIKGEEKGIAKEKNLVRTPVKKMQAA